MPICGTQFTILADMKWEYLLTTFIERFIENSRMYIKNANDTAFTSRQYLRTNLQVITSNCRFVGTQLRARNRFTTVHLYLIHY